MTAERNGALPHSAISLHILRVVLALSALFLCLSDLTQKDSYSSQHYVVAVLLFDLGLLLPSELTFACPQLSPWKFWLVYFCECCYHLLIILSLIGSFSYQINVFSAEYREFSTKSWPSLRLFVLVLTAFTAMVRTSRLIRYAVVTRIEEVSSAPESDKDVEAGTMSKGKIVN